MKNTPISVLGCACIVLAAFLIGMYVGHSISGADIQVSVLPSIDTTEQTTATSTETTATSTETTAPSASIATSPSQTSGKVNINTADLQTLMTLEGIGEVYAQRIIDYRNAHGPFTNIVEITNVSGIGTKRFEAIMDSITVGG